MHAPTTAEEDGRTERRVLHAVLDAYPELFTDGDLVCILVDDLQDFGECDAMKRAVTALCGVRLLHRCGPLVIPTYAALRFKALEEDDSPSETVG
jgi:hypothetical protein